MKDQYDIFECLPCGTLWWRGSCSEMEEVHRKLAEFAKTSFNEIYAKDSMMRQEVARVNEPGETI
jgi:hypothetical protein